MQRVWLSISTRRQRGFSVVEVLLATVVFGVLVSGLIGALVYGRAGTASAGDRQRAIQIAEEGIEAIRSVGSDDYALLTNGTYGLAQIGGTWALLGTLDTTGIYTRQVTIADGGTDRKNITATVSWPQPGGTTGSVTLTSRMTNWLAALTPTITPGPIMMAYSKTTATPYYRIWNGTSWSTEGIARVVSGNINYVVLKSSRTRNEAILGVQTSTGGVYTQVWNGSTWSPPTLVGTGPTGTRSFDIEYEKNSDRAVIAYSPTAASTDFAYRTWDGTTLSAATTVTAPPTTGAIRWMELQQNPLSTSNEVSMMMVDANADIYGMAWTGSTWSDMGVTVAWDISAAATTKKTIDVEYEQTSGEALFMWGDSVATDQHYRPWNGTALGTTEVLDIPAQGGITEWIQMTARPNSNEILVGFQDAAANLNTRKWSGTAWDTATQHAEHSAAVENITSRTFDVVYETTPANAGKAWLLWGNGTTVSKKQWSGTAWGTASTLTSSDDTSFIRLKADPVSGAVFAGIYEDATSATDDIWESRLTGGGTTWTAKNSIWVGPTSATPAYFRIDIATP